MRAGCQVGFNPDDRLDPRSRGCLVEVDHAVHTAMVGEGDGRHAHLLDALDQLLYIAEAIQQGVFGVDVQDGQMT